ncbi:ion channel [Mycoplasmopsis adleri]|uniref:potassium channel family protein n=1 Tax=Mycoplasmopsis adleri TaxID=51362 RepID=UPI003872DF41
MQGFIANQEYWVNECYETSPAGSSTVRNFPEALYFSAITLTTIGYGGFTPKSPFSRMIVPIISIVGIAIIAIPGGVISATVITSIKESKTAKKAEPEKISEAKNEFYNMVDKEIERLANKIVDERERLKKLESKAEKEKENSNKK